EAELDHIRERVEAAGLRTHLSRGESLTVIGCIGDEARLGHVPLLTLPGVAAVHPVMKPYKLASREFSPAGTRVPLGPASPGGRELVVVAGPRSVEGPEMLRAPARAVREAGARALRGGAFKPPASPYSSKGMGAAALEILAEVRAESGLPIVTEVM